MKIDCISDLHGHRPNLAGGDLLIVAGDLTARGAEWEYFQFFDWLHEQKYRKKILIAGNHDTQMQDEHYRGPVGIMEGAFDYLCDSGSEFEGLKIWGSPWTKSFVNENPRALAFTCRTEEELSQKWECIPEDIDILVTHSPPRDVLDELVEEGYHVGSVALNNVVKRIKPRLHVFGHIHESYGEWTTETGMMFINASYVNECYEPVNKPIRIEL